MKMLVAEWDYELDLEVAKEEAHEKGRAEKSAIMTTAQATVAPALHHLKT